MVRASKTVMAQLHSSEIEAEIFNAESMPRTAEHNRRILRLFTEKQLERKLFS